MRSFEEMYFDILEHLDTGPITLFGEIVRAAVEKEAGVANARIERKLQDDPHYPWESEMRDSTLGELWQVAQLGGTFVLVALNQSFEISVAHCLDEIFRERANEASEQAAKRMADERVRHRSLMQRLEQVVPDLKQLPGYSELEELRDIVNAWKHVGFVSKKLAEKNRGAAHSWERGQPLDNLDEHYEKLKEGTTIFSKVLAARLRAHWASLPPVA